MFRFCDVVAVFADGSVEWLSCPLSGRVWWSTGSILEGVATVGYSPARHGFVAGTAAALAFGIARTSSRMEVQPVT